MIKHFAVIAATAAAGASAALITAPAHAAETRLHEGICSVRTLNGTYSGNISGSTANGPFNFQATNVFYGDGTGDGVKVTRVDLSGATEYTAKLTYTLASDCTGTLTVVRSTGTVVHYVITVTDEGRKVAMLQTDRGSVADGVTDLVTEHHCPC